MSIVSFAPLSHIPCRMMRSQTARTESQQGREVKRVRNHGITKWTDETPTDSCREVGKMGRVDFGIIKKCVSLPDFVKETSLT